MQSVPCHLFLRDPSSARIINITLPLFQLYQTGEFKYYDYGSDNVLHYNQVRESLAQRKKINKYCNENIPVVETESGALSSLG